MRPRLAYRKEKRKMTKEVSKKEVKLEPIAFFAAMAIGLLLVMLISPRFAFAVEGAATVKAIIEQMIDVIGMIFVAAGVILAVYAIGQLVLAFKNEDADSKSRASTLLVVSIVLIGFPAIVKGLNLTQYIV